jgi:hypothetical protein
MKIQSIGILRWNNDTEEPILLDGAFNLAEYNFFTRGSVKEFLLFASKTVMKRIGAGINGVDYEGSYRARDAGPLFALPGWALSRCLPLS